VIRIDLGKSDGASNKKGGTFLNVELPPALRAKVQQAQVTTTTVVVVGVSLAISCLLPLFSSQYQQAIQKEYDDEMKTMSKRVAELNTQIDTYTPFKRELQSYEDQKKVVSDRLGVVRKLLEQRNAPVNTLDAIAQSLPQRSWLTSIDLALEGAGTTSLVGTAYSNEEISDLLDNLSRSIYLDRVSLEDVTLKGDARNELKGFSITASPKARVEASSLYSGAAKVPTTPAAPGTPATPPAGDAAANTPPPAQKAPDAPPAVAAAPSLKNNSAVAGAEAEDATRKVAGKK
jgi:Tfp pilus assembly protein PilN